MWILIRAISLALEIRPRISHKNVLVSKSAEETRYERSSKINTPRRFKKRQLIVREGAKGLKEGEVGFSGIGNCAGKVGQKDGKWIGQASYHPEGSELRS